MGLAAANPLQSAGNTAITHVTYLFLCVFAAKDETSSKSVSKSTYNTCRFCDEFPMAKSVVENDAANESTLRLI